MRGRRFPSPFVTSVDTDFPSVATVSASQLVNSVMEPLNVATARMKIGEFVQVGRYNTLLPSWDLVKYVMKGE